MHRLTRIAPQDIETKSFQIIEREFFAQTSKKPEDFDEKTFRIIQRVIHATGDFSFAANLRFHEKAIEYGIRSIRSGQNIYCDVSMGASGVSEKLLSRHGGRVICHINEQSIADEARDSGTTRTETALSRIVDDNIGIISIGNAPTALVKTMELVDAGRIKPELIVGVPVGFVNALESKAILSERDYPFITCTGRKGGTPVAVAIVNALIRLAA